MDSNTALIATPETPTRVKATSGIHILGAALSSGNRGVLALAASLVRLATRADPSLPLHYSIVHRSSAPVDHRVGEGWRRVPVINARRSPRRGLSDNLFLIVLASVVWRVVLVGRLRSWIERRFRWIRGLRQARFAGDIRGGDSFSDIYGLQRLVEGSLPALTALLVQCPLVQFPQTYGPFKSRIARWIARFILSRSAVIIARDKASQAVALELVRHRRPVLLSPDVAFALEPLAPQNLNWKPATSSPEPFLAQNPIGINVSGLLYRGGYNRKNMFDLKLEYAAFIRELVIAVLQASPADILLIPHTWAPPGDVESDNEACREVWESLPDTLRTRVRWVGSEYDAHEIKWIIGQCRFVVAARMHACIAALSQGVPAVGVAYSMKFRGVFESVGMQDWIVDGRTQDNASAIATVLQRLQEADTIRPQLVQAGDRARQELADLFQRLVDGTLVPKRPDTAEGGGFNRG